MQHGPKIVKNPLEQTRAFVNWYFSYQKQLLFCNLREEWLKAVWVFLRNRDAGA